MPNSPAQLIFAGAVSIGGHYSTGLRLIFGSAGPGDMLQMLADSLLVEIGAGVELSQI